MDRKEEMDEIIGMTNIQMEIESEAKVQQSTDCLHLFNYTRYC